MARAPDPGARAPGARWPAPTTSPFPILGTTLTTIIPFLSFVFLSGRLSLYYVPLAVAIATAMGASVFVALAWTPVALNTIWLRPRGAPAPAGDAAAAKTAPPAPPAPRPPDAIERAVGFTLRRWPLVLALAVLSMGAAAWIYARKVDHGGFWRVPEQETLYLGVRLPEGTDVMLTSETLKRFEREILPVPEGVHARSQVWRNQGQLAIEFKGRTLYSELPLLYRARLIDMAEKMAGMGIYISGFSDQSYVKGFFGMMSLNSTIKIAGYNSRVARHDCRPDPEADPAQPAGASGARAERPARYLHRAERIDHHAAPRPAGGLRPERGRGGRLRAAPDRARLPVDHGDRGRGGADPARLRRRRPHRVRAAGRPDPAHRRRARGAAGRRRLAGDRAAGGHRGARGPALREVRHLGVRRDRGDAQSVPAAGAGGPEAAVRLHRGGDAARPS